MAYASKTYICFDADTDMNYYRLMTAWKENGNIAFNFHDAHDINNIWRYSSEETIKRKLRERLNNTKVLVVLVGKKTKNLYRFVRWEIEYAIENDIPIIVVNLNGKKEIDEELCPPILRNELAIHIPYGQKILNYALNDWPSCHKTYSKKSEAEAYHYKKSVYADLGL